MEYLALLNFNFARASRWLLAFGALGFLGLAGAQGAPGTGQQGAAVAQRSVGEWLMRMHDASRQRNYIGTFMVWSNTGAMSSARIWHAGESEQQVERVEVLSGTPRSTFRRNDEVLTFLPERRIVRSERREGFGLFPDILKSGDASVPEFYAARALGSDRVAGFDADIVQLAPKDNLRFGYRIWSEKKSGLVLKLQTLDPEGNVLEQAAFSELQLDAPIKLHKLARLMAVPDGWRVEKPEPVRTCAATEGWSLKTAVAGFKPMSCYKRPASASSASDGAVQWIFSDGLASVSLFIEAYDRQRHAQEGLFAAGATHTLTRRIQDGWLTAVGEVPPHALRAFAQSLERRR